MLQTRALRSAQAYVPLIKFKGHHNPPASLDHAPQAHPASPSGALPDSFATYRKKAQQHGPLGRSPSSGSSSSGYVHLSLAGQSQIAYGAIGSKSGQEMGPVKAPKGVAFDRSELPARFGRLKWEEGDIEAVESGGASLW